jgi:hypothetical protein
MTNMVSTLVADEDELPASLALVRDKHDDSTRTKILKEVLRDSVELYHKAKEGLPKMAAPQAGAQVGKNKKEDGDDLRRGALSAHHMLKIATQHLGTVQCSDGVDDLCVDLADARDASAVLKDTGKRVNHLCNQLRAIQQPTPRTPSSRAASQGGARVGARPPGESVGVAQSRVERLAHQYIVEHVKFPKLEELSDNVEGSSDYEGLRKYFSTRFFHHPNLQFLDDHKLQDKEAFKKCIWKSAPSLPQIDVEPALRRRASKLQTTGLHQKVMVRTGSIRGTSKAQAPPVSRPRARTDFQ